MMSVTELLSRARRAIESGEASLRAAAEDIAVAQEQGATQRQIAEAIGKSAAWVNRLLKWRESGYQDDTAFGPQAKASRQRAQRVQAPERQRRKPATTSEQAQAAADNPDMREQLAVAPEGAPEPEAVATGSSSTPPPGDDDIPAFLDRRPLSPEDQRAYDAIKSTWNSHVLPLWNSNLRSRSRADHCRSNPSEPSRSRARPRDAGTGCPAQESRTKEGAGTMNCRFEYGASLFRTFVKKRKRVAITTFGPPDVATNSSTMTFIRPKFRAHVKAHKTVIANERWFRKGQPFLGKPFTVKKTVERHATADQDPVPGREASGQGWQRRNRRCLPPAPG